MGKNISKIYRKTKNWIPHATRHFLGSSRSLFALKQNKKKIAAKPGLLCRVLARGQKTVMPAADSPCVAPAQPFGRFFQKSPFFRISGQKKWLHKSLN